MNEWLQRIELHPQVCNGKPVIRGTRIPVQVLVEQLAAGETWEHLLRGYPGLQREDLQAALLYASVTMERLDLIPPLAA
jgi:uncharacterized protein (DUF433 family)